MLMSQFHYFCSLKEATVLHCSLQRYYWLQRNGMFTLFLHMCSLFFMAKVRSFSSFLPLFLSLLFHDFPSFFPFSVSLCRSAVAPESPFPSHKYATTELFILLSMVPHPLAFEIKPVEISAGGYTKVQVWVLPLRKKNIYVNSNTLRITITLSSTSGLFHWLLLRNIFLNLLLFLHFCCCHHLVSISPSPFQITRVP